MVDASGLGFGSVLWGQGKLVYESGGFNPLYQGISSNFLDEDNLTTRIEESVASRELKGVELFVFTDNLVFESVFYKGTSERPFLFELVLRLHQMRGEIVLYVILIVGTRMIEIEIDGLFMRDNLGGMMRGTNPLSFSRYIKEP